MVISRSKFDELGRSRRKPSVSIYIPTFRTGENQADRLRWKNAIRDAEKELKIQGYGEEIIRKVMRSAHHDLEDLDLWLKMSDGYCAFLSESDDVHLKLPVHFDQMVCVTDKYVLSPILPYFQDRTRFFLLLLSKGGVRFFEGNKHSITIIEISDLVPEGEKDFETNSSKNLQFHSAQGHAIYHGEGAEEDQKTKRFLRAVDSGLMEMLHDERAPLIVAGSDFVVTEFQRLASYPHTVEESHIIAEDLDVDPVVLHEQAWEIVRSHVVDPAKLTKNEYDALTYEGRTEDDLEEISQLAKHGRIEQLLVRRHFIRDLDQTDYLLVETCIQEAFEKGSTIDFRIKDKMPIQDKVINATLRY